MSADTAELVLGDEADAVAVARRFAATVLRGEPQVDDVKLIATELVTNALLHGGHPVTLRIMRATSTVRVEVQDPGEAQPVSVKASAGAMTGRGLALVAALSSSWGVAAGRHGGKVVWAEVPDDHGAHQAPAPQAERAAALPPQTPRGGNGHRLYSVELGDVPTELLQAAKAQIDNLVREFVLEDLGTTTTGKTLPPELATLVATVVHGFADARSQIKEQAAASAARGEAQTRLTLALPANAAEAGERYLAALDEADRYARSARLLTLESPLVHRLFRRWYVQSLVDQLRWQADGGPRPTPQAFVERLAALVDELAARVPPDVDVSGPVPEALRAARHAILATPPPQLGRVGLAVRYVADAADPRSGSYLHEVLAHPGAVRLVVGAVHGDAARALRLASVVLGEFRAAGSDAETLRDVGAAIDARLGRYLDPRDALALALVEVRDDGGTTVMRWGDAGVVLLPGRGAGGAGGGGALGSGVLPRAVDSRLEVGDRLLLVSGGGTTVQDPDTSGTVLARLPSSAPSRGSLEDTLAAAGHALHEAVLQGALDEDVALLAVEYRGASGAESRA